MTSRDFHFRLIKSGATCVITSGSMTSKVDDVICNCPSVRQKIVIPDGRDDFEVSSSWLNFNDLMLDAAKLQQSQVSVPTSPNDPMMIFFTSGTTGYVEH
jgi:acyl-coenzyme A synthetase/AMP-(fatty) acid ligase